MANIRTLFWDVGGVLGTNGWDRYARTEAVQRFGLDGADFERRHQEAVGDFETGRLTLDAYLRRTVFHESRAFEPEVFKDFMFAQSRPFDDAVAVARMIASSGRYVMAVLSNESRELNDYRIELFGMGTIFSAFFSSCYVGLRKPGEAIFRLALDVTQTPPGEAVLIDDREENIRSALSAGMQVIRHTGEGALSDELRAAGVLVP